MSNEHSEAIVIRGVDFSETSRIVTVLTPNRGKIALMAKGVRRKNSALSGLLDSYNRVSLHYQWKDSRSVQTVTEGVLVDGYSRIKSDLEKSTYGAFILELAGKLSHENYPNEDVYRVLVHGLDQFCDWGGDVRSFVTWWSVQLMTHAGFAPSVDQCGGCGELLTDSVGFSNASGLVCGNCRSDRKLHPKIAELFRAMAVSFDACPVQKAEKEVYDLVRSYAAFQLECDFRTIRVIEQMFS
jgi:DNA repair protein RecO (recombination protein O)